MAEARALGIVREPAADGDTACNKGLARTLQPLGREASSVARQSGQLSQAGALVSKDLAVARRHLVASRNSLDGTGKAAGVQIRVYLDGQGIDPRFGK